jgi:hypothetical protein
MEKKKLNKELIKGLESGKIEVELKTLDIIRKDGFAQYLPILADLYRRSTSDEVKDKISAIFQDIKDSDGIPIIIDLLCNTSHSELKSMLLTACWSSSLDFSSYLDAFIDVAMEGEYMQVFEVLTVVENFEYNPPKESIESSIKRVQTAMIEMKDVKIEMLEQLNSVLKSFLN